MACKTPADSGLRTDLALPARIGIVAGLALFAAVFLWAQFTQISGAVIASGEAVVRGKPKMVQSLDGGIAAEIRVADGELVRANDVLLRLDPTLLRINLDMYRNRLAEERARRNRLEAEQLGARTVAFDYETEYLDGIRLDVINAGQRQIFEARRDVLRGRTAQLNEKIAQFHNQISGVEGLIASKRDQLVFVEKELADVRALHAEGLTRESEVLALQRAQARLLGELTEHQSELARITNSIRDTEMEILQSSRQFREQVVTELREAVRAGEELVLQIVTTLKQLDRIEIKAPVDGIIHELQISTVGGVVPPGETIMQVIPVAEGVDFELRIEPKSIDQVMVGQQARVVFPAFDRRNSPEIFGTVSRISASSVTDPATGQQFYRVGLTIPAAELARLTGGDIIPGMPVEAFLQTGERTVLSYLTRPFTDQLRRAFREG